MSSKGRGFREPRRRGFDDDDYMPRDFRGPRGGGDRSGGGGDRAGGGDRFGGGGGSGGGRPFSGAPRSMAVPEGPAVDATVKWFNAEKGFGFAELADGSGDVFMHIATLQVGGHQSVEPGTTMKVQIGQGQKGRQVTAVVEITGQGPVPQSAPRPPRSGGFDRGDRGPRPPMQRRTEGPATEVMGKVKWFNPEKGFGFVVADDGGKDVFVHISVVERSGIRALAEGQAVKMMVEQGMKGREAVSINLAD